MVAKAGQKCTAIRRIIAPATIAGDLTEALAPGNVHALGAQGLQVAGARGLEVDQAAGVLGHDGINAKLVRSRVDAQLVGAAAACDGRVLNDLGLKLLQVADIVHALFKAPAVARCQADPLYSEPR